jgi:hypothetical protein
VSGVIHTDRSGETARAWPWDWLILGVLAVAGVAFRLFLLRTGRLGFDSDQAVTGVGALRMLQGGPLHAIVPGNSWGGDTLTYLFIPHHLIFEPSVTLMRAGVLPYTVLLWITFHWAIQRTLDSRIWALAASAALIFPSPMVLDWTMHSGSLYILVLIALNLIFPPFVSLVQSLPERGWDTRNHTRAAAIGLVFGFALWCHFTAVVMSLACIATALFHPRRLALVVGLAESPSPPISPRFTRFAAGALQIAMLITLVLLTRLLLIGGHIYHLGPVDLKVRHLGNPLTLFLILLVARRAMAARFGWSALAPLGIVTLCVSMWIGALPLVLHLHVHHAVPFGLGGAVGSLSTFWKQFTSIFTIAHPVITGTLADFAVPLALPAVIRVSALALGWISLFALLSLACVAWTRRTGRGTPLLFILLLLLIQFAVFSISALGVLAVNPRYLFFFIWVQLVAHGALVHLLWRRNPALRALAIAVLGALIAYGVASNLAVPGRLDLHFRR